MTLKIIKDYIGIILYLLSGLEECTTSKKSSEVQKLQNSILLKLI
jgi:hypothetical protein